MENGQAGASLKDFIGGAEGGRKAAPGRGRSGGDLWATAKVWLGMVREGFLRDRLLLRASALTYTTVLSIVPFLAVAFSVLKGFGFQNTELIRDMMMQAFAGREQVADAILTYIDKTNVRTLGGVGVGLLFFTVINLLSNIESSFNTIWGVERGRSLTRKTADYFSISLIVPVLIVTAISFTATMQSNAVVQWLLSVSVLSRLYLFAFKLVPYVSVWLALTFIYIYMPNTRVRIPAALAGGVLAGTLWQAAQWLYIVFQVGAAKYNAIYGSFAQVPLFLVWVYISWVVVLLGAEMSFAFQNLRSYEKEAKFEQVSQMERKRLGLTVLLLLAERFRNQSGPPGREELAGELKLPGILLDSLLGVLVRAGVAGRLAQGEEEPRFSIIRPLEALRVQDMLDLFDADGGGALELEAWSRYPGLAESLRILKRDVAASPGNRTLADLLPDAETG